MRHFRHLRHRLLLPRRLLSSAPVAGPTDTINPSLSFFPLAGSTTAAPGKLNLTEIADSFKSWFSNPPPPATTTTTASSSSQSLLDQIYFYLSNSPDDSSLNLSLSSLNLTLSESLLLEFLRYTPHPLVLSKSKVSGSSNFESDVLFLRLKFFDWSGRQPGPYRHTRVAYHSIFKLLARARLASVVIDWLNLFQSSYRMHNGITRLHDTLVIGYSVAGRPELAMQLFARMRFQGLDLDSFGYHVLLNSLVEESVFDSADALTNQIRARGIEGPVTAAIDLKSMCLRGRIEEAMEYFQKLPESSPLVSDHMVGSLVHALCSRARFDDAARVVDRIGSPFAYSAFLGGLLTSGKLNEASQFLQSKRVSDHYVADSFHYNNLICRLLRKNRLAEVYDALVEMREQGVAPSRVTMNYALCFFCKAGMVDVAIQLYNSHVELGLTPTSLVYSCLITSLCRIGAADDISRVLEDSLQQGYFPKKEIFTVLAGLLLREGKLDNVKKLLDNAFHKNIRPTGSLLTRYIAALCKAGKVEEAWLVPQMVGKESNLARYKSTYTNLIRAFVVLQKVDFLPQMIIDMQEHGHVPGKRLYGEVLCCLCETGMYDEVLSLLDKQLERKELDKLTCYNYFIRGASQAKKPELAREIYNRMEKAGIVATKDTNILMLQSYLKSRRIGDALTFFYLLKDKQQPSNKLYNVFITGLCEAGKPEQAMVFWKEVREKGLIPSLECYEELVHALCSSNDYDLAVKVLQDFEETKRPASSFLCNVLLLHTLKGPDLFHAWLQSDGGTALQSKSCETSKESSESGELLLGELIAAFSGGIRMKENLESLDEMVEKFFPVDIFTYNMLLKGFSMTGRMDCACSLFQKLPKKGYQPNRWTYDIMVQGFVKQGNRKEAENWMEEMYRNGFQPTWYTMSMYSNTRSHYHTAFSSTMPNSSFGLQHGTSASVAVEAEW